MQHPSARWITPQRRAGAAVFLSSDASDFITGQTLVADGGMTIAI
jgi:NAD(P)-dependent dehydrogenase (short-subunit alcohol dehydrogenase family)